MRIYFDGCSNTHAKGYLGDNFENIRWSKLVCDALGAEEVNYSRSGGSNIRILRQLTTVPDKILIRQSPKNYNRLSNNKYTVDDCDLVIIQLTFPNRTEFYGQSEKRFLPITHGAIKNLDGISIKPWMTDSLNEFWKTYYFEVYQKEYGDTTEEMVYESVKNACKAKNKPLIILSCYPETKLKYDIMITNDTYPHDRVHWHPDERGQVMIASDVVKMIKERNYDSI
tara:strand:- start:1490 stop:2167 length:678 start_codon:yes stop_codon:yes gene_type:complete